MLKFNNQTWFLDHTGLNHKVKYLGKWKKNDYLLYQTILDNTISEYCYQNGYKKHMNKQIQPIRLWYKGDSINIIFDGSFFKGYDIYKNIKSLQKHHKQIIDNVFLNNKSKYSDKMQINNPKIYRIDIACNTNWDNLDRIEIKGRSTKLRKYYENKDKRKEVTGIQFGNRGRDYTHLRIYNKRFDANKFHDYMRFGNAEFIRMEYELGSRPIKNYGVRTLEMLNETKHRYDTKDKKFKKGTDNSHWNWEKKYYDCITNWESLLIKLHRTAYPITDHDNKNPYFKQQALPNFEYKKDEKYYYKEQVKGIIEKHFNYDDIKWLKNRVDLN